MKRKLFSLLVLLVAAVSGAWATDAVPAYNLSVAESNHGSGTISYTVQDKDDAEKITENAKGANEGDIVTMTVTPDEGYVVGSVTASTYTTWEAAGARRRAPAAIPMLGNVTLAPVEGKANTWTFTMPAANVQVSATYIPVAAFAPAEPSGTLAPTAAEGVIAGEDKAIIVAGTVANIPETTNPQGTVKYFVTDNKDMTAEQAAKANGWVEALPTAAGYTGSYADDFQVYVWYYIQAATGYADSEPQRIEVTVLSNLFDLTLNAANAYTIDATQTSKGTVSVKEGTGAAVNKTGDITDEGKLKAVKMGSEVKLNAKQGYKFRKVEVKKKGGAAGIVNPVVGQIIGSDGKNYDANATLPDGVTAVAMIAYVSGSNGLALALTDEGQMDWSTAQTTCAAHTAPFTGGTWKLATKDEWQLMINAVGGFNNLKNGFSSVGGTNLQSNSYWTNTEYESDDQMAYVCYFNSNMLNKSWKTNSSFVRACLAF